MPTLSEINFESALNSLSPEVVADLSRRAAAGETFSREQIMDMESGESGVLDSVMDSTFGFLGDIYDRFGSTRPKVQATYESDRDFWRGKEVEDEGPNETTGRGILREAPSALTGLGVNVGSVMAGGKYLPKLLGKAGRHAPGPAKLFGYALGGYLGEYGTTAYGVGRRKLPLAALGPAAQADYFKNYLEQIVGTRDSERYSGPRTHQELPGVPQDLGTAMDWNIDDPLMAAGIGLGAKMGAKGGKVALEKGLDLTAPTAARATSPAAEEMGKLPTVGEVEGALAADPKYREMVGKKIVSWFSGTGTLEAGLPGAKPVRAVEFDEAKIVAYNKAHGTNFSPSSVLDDQAIKDLKKADPDLFHASPECKLFSGPRSEATALPRGCKDLDFLNAIIRAIKEARPKNISIENVPGYKTKFEGKYFKELTKALDDGGYRWRDDIVNAKDLGASSSRKRLFIRATRVEGNIIPPPPPKVAEGDWWKAVIAKGQLRKAKVETADWHTLTKKGGTEPLVGIQAVERAIREKRVRGDQPIWYNGDGSNTRLPQVVNPGKAAPSLMAAPQKARILMPDAEYLPDNMKDLANNSIEVTGRMLARLQGLPGSFKIPKNFYKAKEVIGNGMHVLTTDALIRPLIAQTPLELLASKGGTAQLAVELGEALKVGHLDFVDGAKNFTPIDEGIMKTTGKGAGRGRIKGAIHRGLDNILNITQKIEGVGGDEFLRKSIVDTGLDGILVGGKRIGGQLSYEAAVAKSLKEFAEKAADADIFRYLELKDSPKTKGVKDLVFRESARSEAMSRRIVDAIQSVDLGDLGRVSDKGRVKLRQDLAEALKETPLRNAKGEIFRHKGKEVVFGGEKAVDLAAYMVEDFRANLVDINKIRVSMGNNAINFLPRYFPHMHKLNVMEDFFGSLIDVPDAVVKGFHKDLASGKSFSNYPWFGNILHRATKKEDYSRNIIEVFENYSRGAKKIIHNAIPAKVVRDRVKYLAKAGKLTDVQATIYNKWIDEGLLGKAGALDKWIQSAPLGIPMTAYHIKRLGDRFSRNILVGSTSFIINNIASLAQVVASAGVRNTVEATYLASPDLVMKTFAKDQAGAEALLKGTAFTGNRMGMDFALSHSKVMQQRMYTGYEEIGREALGRGKIYNAVSSLIDTADQFNVAVSFNANYMSAIKRGVPHEQAVKFADDMAYKNQAIYSAAYKPELLRSRYLGAIAPFQTWTNNLNSFVRNEIIGGRMGGRGSPGLRRAAGEVDKEFFDQLSPTDRLGVSIKFVGAAMAINGIMVSLGLPPSYNMGSVIPFEKQAEGLAETVFGTGYGRTDTLFIGKPIREIFFGLRELAYGDAEGLEENINDPEIRELIRSVLNLALPFGGTQVGRTAEGLADMYQGFMPVSSPAGGYTEAEFGSADNKSILPFDEDYMQAPLLGPKRATSYLEERYPDTGYYEPTDDNPVRSLLSMLEGLTTPQRVERQFERFEEEGGLSKLFPFMPGKD